MEKKQVEDELSWLGARMREPSTYVGLAMILAAIHISDSTTWAGIITSFGIGIGGLLGVLLPEHKTE